MIQSRLLPFAALTLAGCAVALSPASGPGMAGSSPVEANDRLGPGRTVSNPDSGATTSQVGATGSILIAILWPEREAAYRAQLIPLSAAKIRVKVLAEDGTTELANELLTRPTGTSQTSTASIEIKAGANRTVDVGAYSENNLLVASGSAKVDVGPSTETEASIALVPTAVPAILGISPANAGPGAQLLLTGSNFLLNGGP